MTKNIKIFSTESYIFKKVLSLSTIYSKSGHEVGKIFKGEESIEILKLFGLITNIDKYQKIYNHVEEHISQEFRLKV